jgi:hypothetical protein
MATDRQIAANRRNARRSTGPRSRAGRKRSSRNSFRHGLATGLAANAQHIKRIEHLARKIAGASADIVTPESARTIAQAQFDLAQIVRLKVALMSRVVGFEMTGADMVPTPRTESNGAAGVIGEVLAELSKLDRYERRAVGRRTRALRNFLEQKKHKRP